MHVEDVGRALAELLDGEVNGPVNVASGDCVTLRALLTHIAGTLGRPDLLEFGLEEPQGPDRLEARTFRLREEVGFRPRYTLSEGLNATVAAVLAEKA
jgi:nucleoside-diphosphate-sugar epimerase